MKTSIRFQNILNLLIEHIFKVVSSYLETDLGLTRFVLVSPNDQK